MKKNTLLSAFYILTLSCAFAQWQSKNPLNAGAFINSVYFIDYTHGRAVDVTSNNQSLVFSSYNRFFSDVTNFLKAPASEPWVLCYESDNIYIYERWIKKSGGDSLRERKGVMFVKCNVGSAVKSITNYETQKNWMKSVEETKLIKRKSDTSWITYTLFDLPWPLDNRDLVSEYHVKEIKPGSYVQIKINTVINLIKEIDGITRINNYNAIWDVKKLNDASTAITFCASCPAKPVVPAFILDPMMRKTFQKNLLNLKNILEAPISSKK